LKKKQSNKQKSAKKQAQKTSKFQLNQATCKSSKKPAPSKKKQAQIRGKTARLATLHQQYSISSDLLSRYSYSCVQ